MRDVSTEGRRRRRRESSIGRRKAGKGSKIFRRRRRERQRELILGRGKGETKNHVLSNESFKLYFEMNIPFHDHCWKGREIQLCLGERLSNEYIIVYFILKLKILTDVHK